MNLSIWVLEVVAGFIFLIPAMPMFNRFIMNVGLSSGVAPILYILGMSDVRESIKRKRITFTAKMRSCCTRNNRVAPD